MAADSLSGVAEDIRAALPLLARHSSGAQGQPQPLEGLRQALRAASDVRPCSSHALVTDHMSRSVPDSKVPGRFSALLHDGGRW